MPRLKERLEADGNTRELVSRDAKIARLEGKLREVGRQYQDALKQIHEAEKRTDFLNEVSQEREWEEWERDVKKSKSKATAIVLASDWHIGETVEKSTVNGLNEYNLSICEKRIKRFFQKIPEYVERYVPMAREIILWAGGDFVGGYIHEELVENNSLSPSEECLFFREHWNAGIRFLLRECKNRKIIIPTSWGNHARTSQKPRVSTGAYNSFEWLTYKIQEADWRNEPRVVWKVTDSYHNHVHIFGRTIRFHHGDAIKYQGGVGGIHIPIRKAVAQWNKAGRADLECMGHFHEALEGGYYIVNGSLIGYAPWSLRIKADFQPPTQAFIVFDANRGLRQFTRIFVD